MDWDLIIGWMGDTAEEGGSSWRGRRGGAKSSLSANVKFSVTIRLFALLGRCDSEFDVKRSVLSGASGRRGFREAACLYLPLRQIQRCRDLNPPRPGCNHFSVLGQFLELFWGRHLHRYLLKWNSFSSSSSWVFVYAVRSLRGIPPSPPTAND